MFAREFAREMRTPGIDVREMMLTVRESVERLAASVNHPQRPAIYDESRGRFVFHEAPSTAPAAATSAGVAPAPAEASPALPPAAASGASAPTVPSAAPGRGKSAEQIEDELWATFSGSQSRAGYAAYLREYPTGRYAAAARVQLEVLGPVERPSPAAEGGIAAAKPSTAAAVAPQARPAPAAPAPVAPASAPPVAVAAAPAVIERPSTPVTGKRYRGMSRQFELIVEAQDGALVVQAFRVTYGRFNGTELRCGMFRNSIDLDKQFNVSAWCSGPPVSFRLRGRFPRVDVYSGQFVEGTIELVEAVGDRVRGR